jgi:hypothetical protein
MVAERNTKLPKHPELETIPNLQVSIIILGLTLR